MTAFGAVLLIAAAAFGGSTATAATAPSLRTLPSAPVLTVGGRGFAAGERVALTLSADRVYRARARASARGTFTVRFPLAPRCVVWSATARGSRSGHMRFRSPPVDCRRYVDPGTSAGPAPVVGTGVAGAVRRVPIRPVCVAELPCDGPAPGVVVEVADGHGVVAQTVTGSDGRFTVFVPPGSYRVSVTGGMRPVAPAAVVVKSGSFAEVRISIDTGIR